MNTHALLPALVIGMLISDHSGPSAHVAPKAIGPAIRFDTTLHDFGSLPLAGDGRCAFVFTNTGDAPLVIQSVRSSCGCLVPAWDHEPVPPGGTGNVRLRYDTHRIGAFNKSVTVTSNAMNAPTLVLRIKGMVSPDSSRWLAR